MSQANEVAQKANSAGFNLRLHLREVNAERLSLPQGVRLSEPDLTDAYLFPDGSVLMEFQEAGRRYTVPMESEDARSWMREFRVQRPATASRGPGM